VLAGFKIVVVNCDEKGNIDVADLKVRLSECSERVCV
jgi:glycine cleavage system protein P-like pyridoxal-binding family